MPLLGHGHYQGQADVFAYTAKCDGCSSVVRFTSRYDPGDDLSDMDWTFESEDSSRLLCLDCNPKAPGNHTKIPAGIRSAFEATDQQQPGDAAPEEAAG